jgi:hypothetical protein
MSKGHPTLRGILLWLFSWCSFDIREAGISPPPVVFSFYLALPLSCLQFDPMKEAVMGFFDVRIFYFVPSDANCA